MNNINAYAVIWHYAGTDYIIDVDDEEHAHKLARHIAESPGRNNVRVIVSTVDVPDEIIEKIKVRISSRIKELAEPLGERLHGNH